MDQIESQFAERGRPLRPVVGVAISAAAAVLAVVVAALLVRDYAAYHASDPMNSEALAALKAQAARNPKDAALLERIRALDLALREEHFRHVAVARRGNGLLLGCAVLFLLAAKVGTAHAARLSRPRGKLADVEAEMKRAAWGRRMVVTLVVLLAAGAISPLAVRAYVRMTTVPPPPPHFADPADVARYWPRFRGPGGRAISAYDNVPTEWDGNTGRNILWKTPVPLPGKSSPIVWGDRVFLTGGKRDRREVYCYDAATGKRLWERPVVVPDRPGKAKEAFEDTGYAASTPVCDDRHVFAIFANGDLACFRHDGELVWVKALGQPDNQYTHGSSLAMYRNLLLVLLDQGNLENYMSKLLAFDGASGRAVWEKRRPVGSSWGTPALMASGGGQQLIASANPWVMAYDPNSGAELWRAHCMEGGDVASSPVFANGTVFAVCAETKLYAIRADGAGDVTETHVAWSAEDGLPDITSPVTDGTHVWLLDSGGLLTCYDAQTGEKVYEHELEKVCNASPALAGGRLYVVSIKGVTFVAETGREFKLVATNPLGEGGVVASPAFQNGRIYLRGKKHLFCIGQKPGSTSRPAE